MPSLFCVCVCVAGSTPTHKASSTSTDRDSSERKRPSVAKFQPPNQPPARKNWVPDTQQHVCMVCQRERFTMVRGSLRGRGKRERVVLSVSAGMWCVCDCVFSCPCSSTDGITAADAAGWCATPARSAGWPWRAGPATRSECATSVTPTSTRSKWEGADGGGADTGG